MAREKQRNKNIRKREKEKLISEQENPAKENDKSITDIGHPYVARLWNETEI
jgi:hypothetical protein